MKTTAQLMDRLTQPDPSLLEDIRKIEGDLLILGVGGKMGPSLAILAKRAFRQRGMANRVIGVSRFSDSMKQQALENAGIETIRGDLLEERFLQELPPVPNVIFMAGQKFGTLGQEDFTWAMNTYLPGRVAEKFKTSRIVVFSTGNVYPFTAVSGAGATELTPTDPVGEYAQSCLGRERIFSFFAKKYKTPVLIFRLNYALDLRYGVLNDIARKVWRQEAINLQMGYVNVIWQGDANAYAIRSLLYCQSPANVLNVTGPEKLSLRELAITFGQQLDKQVHFEGEAASTALLSDASKCFAHMGRPAVAAADLVKWTVNWIKQDGEALDKPTKFQVRDGKF
ncbi:MAG: NAD-dependent epimerase/dehydratase family protein [Saprospiraceae bacterium]|nr:NAD-dependent epimerase/dehydratase family protein [Saprospiraceae bacterium]